MYERAVKVAFVCDIDFEVELFNGVITDVTGSRVIQEINEKNLTVYNIL